MKNILMSLLAVLIICTSAVAAEPSVSKYLLDARRSQTMPLTGTSVTAVGKDYYIFAEELEQGKITAIKGAYYIIIRFDRILDKARVESCCWLEDQSGEKTDFAVLLIRGKESQLGYWVQPTSKTPRFYFLDDGTRIELTKFLK